MSKELRKNIKNEKKYASSKMSHQDSGFFYRHGFCVCTRFRNTTQNIDAITNIYI